MEADDGATPDFLEWPCRHCRTRLAGDRLSAGPGRRENFGISTCKRRACRMGNRASTFVLFGQRYAAAANPQMHSRLRRIREPYLSDDRKRRPATRIGIHEAHIERNFP